MQQPEKYIISGGGTGGHIFPALAIANSLKYHNPDCEILFVGAKDRMEMEKVPQAGYPIEGLWISGLQRKQLYKNFLFPVKLMASLFKAHKIIKRFKPDVVIGVGGYASAAVLRQAASMRVPTLIQEQNSYAGITNKWLSKIVNTICVAYEGMERYFPKDKLVFTGNPVRSQMIGKLYTKEEACAHFGLDANAPVIFITGGSLGAASINRAVAKALPELEKHKIQLIWQTGKLYYQTAAGKTSESIKVFEFMNDMDKAYSAADLVVARAGALTISELCVIGKPSILIPSPNVAEDHQTKNAMALVKNNAALMIKDSEVEEKLEGEIIRTIQDKELLNSLSENAGNMGVPDATERIVKEIYKLRKA